MAGSSEDSIRQLTSQNVRLTFFLNGADHFTAQTVKVLLYFGEMFLLRHEELHTTLRLTQSVYTKYVSLFQCLVILHTHKPCYHYL